MRRLNWDNSFHRAFKRWTRKNPALQDRIFRVLEQLAQDPFDPALRTYKLSGQLKGLWACSVEYNCRVVFAFEPDPATGEKVIILIDLGSHDEVY